MAGFLVPDHYKPDLPNRNDMLIACIAWGFSLGVLIFNCSKAIGQTTASYRRRKTLTVYIALLWAEIISSLVLGVICWLYLREYIEPSMQYFFFVIVAWSTQVQCLIQIIINRVGLLMVNRANATRLKWTCFLILLAINISVFCIWVPARLQINETYIHLNNIWDRCEKVIFGIMDAALNFFFIYTVKQRLVANGLKKYTRLYQANLVLVTISIILDVLLICMMSLPNGFVYIQFHPLVYLLKLHIEMNMADLIGKVVKASNQQNSYDYSSRSRTAPKNGTQARHSRFAGTRTRTHIELGDDDEYELQQRENLQGIKRTVETQVVRSEMNVQEDEDLPELHERAVSEASSTKLHKLPSVELGQEK
ncbi:hypothetical protein B0J13DRAFT_453887 [Dactylonectria estremocensis]|uniref:Uncharacterized protein n=1 Tax=Dactylonectria estremocensis TaxID=1079267 RepID=A0A9P9DY60_9HYPO|nr:hypothetical protein B0J13DRAFT_453887 [Dactylonectria estremocensis]